MIQEPSDKKKKEKKMTSKQVKIKVGEENRLNRKRRKILRKGRMSARIKVYHETYGIKYFI